MNPVVPSSLNSHMLARRLCELAGDERNVQVEFLRHLDEFDRRRAYLEAGFGSLWEYCLTSLHLREGAAGRRIGAMKVLRRFPKLEGALRDGRLCLSTVALLGPILTEDNLDDLVSRAAYRTKAEVEHLVATVQPRVAPREGIRRLPAPAPAASTAAPSSSAPAPAATGTLAAPASATVPALALAVTAPAETSAPREPNPEPVRSRAEVRPISEDQWSLRATIDAACKEELETLKALLSHKVPDGDLGAVLREAIRCGIEKHRNRKGATAPAQERRSKAEAGGSRIPAAVRREVWKRDGGSCAWIGDDGRRCGSRWQLEIDHILPLALGGSSTADNLRLTCRAHNMLHAEHVYGRAHMDRYRTGAVTIARDSEGADRAVALGARASEKRSGENEATSSSA